MQLDVQLAAFDGSDFNKRCWIPKGYLMVFCECPDSKSVMESVSGNQGGSTPCLWCEDRQGLGH